MMIGTKNEINYRKYVVANYGEELEKVGYHSNLVEISSDILINDRRLLTKDNNRAGLNPDSAKKLRLLDSIYDDTKKTFIAAHSNVSDSGRFESEIKKVLDPFYTNVVAGKVSQSTADALGINPKFHDNNDDDLLNKLKVTDKAAFLERRFPNRSISATQKTDEGPAGVDNLTKDGGDGDGGDGTGSKKSTSEHLQDLYVLFSEKLVGNYFSDAQGGKFPHKKLSKIIGEQLEHKAMMAAERAYTLAMASRGGNFNAEAYANEIKQSDTYSFLREKIKNASILIESKDPNAVLDGLNMIRTASLDQQALEKEKMGVQSLGTSLQAIQYLMSLDSSIVDISKENTDLYAYMTEVYNTINIGDELPKEKVEILTNYIGKIIGNQKTK